MLTRIQKWGNSLAVRLPKAFADSLGLVAGAHVNLMLAEDRLVVLPLPPYLSADSFGPTVTRENVEKWKSSTWQLSARMEVPSLTAQGIQWALFEADPMPKFLGELSRRVPSDHERRSAYTGTSAFQLGHISLAMVTWNALFRAIPGDQVGTLDDISGEDRIYASAAKEGHAWLVTKPRRLEDRVLAWSIPLERKIGENATVELSLDNVTDLTQTVRGATS